jgi:hypothetical protein
MDSTIKITTTDEMLEKTAPLYHKYSGQTSEQPAYIYLDPEEGTLYADWYGEIGANSRPMDVHHGLRLWWPVSPYLTGGQLAELLEEIKPLAQKVADGWSREWDGTNNVGRLTPEAEEADQEITAAVEVEGEAHVWDAYDWATADGLNSPSELVADFGRDTEAFAANIKQAALQDGVVLIDAEKAAERITEKAKEEE